MSEVVNALVAFAVIVFIFRWATSSRSLSLSFTFSSSPLSTGSSSSSNPRSATAALGFRPKHVTQDMVRPIPAHLDPTHPLQVDQIHTMFPDIPAYVLPSPPPSPPHSFSGTTSASTSCAQATSSSPRTRSSSAGFSSRYVTHTVPLRANSSVVSPHQPTLPSIPVQIHPTPSSTVRRRHAQTPRPRPHAKHPSSSATTSNKGSSRNTTQQTQAGRPSGKTLQRNARRACESARHRWSWLPGSEFDPWLHFSSFLMTWANQADTRAAKGGDGKWLGFVVT